MSTTDAREKPQTARTTSSLVAGRNLEEAPGGRMTSVNPARTDEAVAEVLLGDAATYVEACRAAREAQKQWAAVPAPIHLAGRSEKVLGLERYSPAHDRGLSHGRSRIIRQAYFEGPEYVPLLLRADEHDLPYEMLEAGEIRHRFPAFSPAPETVTLFEPRAGFVRPEETVRAHLDGTAAAGAEFRRYSRGRRTARERASGSRRQRAPAKRGGS